MIKTQKLQVTFLSANLLTCGLRHTFEFLICLHSNALRLNFSLRVCEFLADFLFLFINIMRKSTSIRKYPCTYLSWIELNSKVFFYLIFRSSEAFMATTLSLQKSFLNSFSISYRIVTWTTMSTELSKVTAFISYQLSTVMAQA